MKTGDKVTFIKTSAVAGGFTMSERQGTIEKILEGGYRIKMKNGKSCDVRASVVRPISEKNALTEAIENRTNT